MKGPREFKHAPGNDHEFVDRAELPTAPFHQNTGDASVEPGSWGHYKAICAPFLEMWWRLDPTEPDPNER